MSKPSTIIYPGFIKKTRNKYLNRHVDTKHNNIMIFETEFGESEETTLKFVPETIYKQVEAIIKKSSDIVILWHRIPGRPTNARVMRTKDIEKFSGMKAADIVEYMSYHERNQTLKKFAIFND